jgi:hypothetical protein
MLHSAHKKNINKTERMKLKSLSSIYFLVERKSRLRNIFNVKTRRKYCNWIIKQSISRRHVVRERVVKKIDFCVFAGTNLKLLLVASPQNEGTIKHSTKMP